jgi:hypothetical protein
VALLRRLHGTQGRRSPTDQQGGIVTTPVYCVDCGGVCGDQGRAACRCVDCPVCAELPDPGVAGAPILIDDTDRLPNGKPIKNAKIGGAL